MIAAGIAVKTIARQYSMNQKAKSSLVLLLAMTSCSVIAEFDYRVYKGSFDLLPNFSALTPIASGQSSTIGLSVTSENDGVALLFTKKITVSVDGDYEFSTRSDDGSKLYIDGNVIVDNDGLHVARTISNSVFLTTGTYDLRVEYFENSGGQVLEVAYRVGTQAYTSIPADGLLATPISSQFFYEVYQGSFDVLPDFSLLTPISNGQTPIIDLAVTNQQDDFALVFTKQVIVNTAGTFEFSTRSDDGSKLFIDGDVIVDNDGLHVARTVTNSVFLTAGTYDLRVEFFEQSGGQVFEVAYRTGTDAYLPIPLNGVLETTIPPQLQFDYAVYDGRFEVMPDFSALVPIASGQTPTIDRTVTSQEDAFGLVFSHQITVNKEGVYVFSATSDDGSKILIDDAVVVDNDGLHGAVTVSNVITLAPGTYSLRVEYFDNSGGDFLDITYRAGNADFAPIPADGVLEYSVTERAITGEWGPIIEWPHIAISAANLPDGRIVTWSSTETNDWPSNREFTHSSVFNPINNTFEHTDSDFHDMFCAGLTLVEDGSIIASGGNPFDNKTSTFHPDTMEWTPLANMNDSRWYGTNITLPTNKVFSSFAKNAGNRSEMYDPETDTWTPTPNANMQTLVDEQNAINTAPNPSRAVSNEWYAHLALTPQGDVFQGGPTPTWHRFYPSSNTATESLGQPIGDSARMYGNAVTYDEGKVILIGGSDKRLDNPTSVNNVFLVDLNTAVPEVTQGAPMNYPRALSNAVTLPNGEVLVIGGNTVARLFSDEGSVYPAEIYTPSTDTWRVVSSISIPRNYHSTALLMKDARVLSAGGGACGDGCAANHLDGQIFSPSYLFDSNGDLARRPTLSNVASTISAGNQITVTASSDTTSFSVVRLSGTSHHLNTDQRFLPIASVNNGDGTFTLTFPANPNVLIMGNYWLFAVNDNDTPSIGETIQVLRKTVNPDENSDTGITRDWWLDVTGNRVLFLTRLPTYPASPSGSEQLNSFEGPSDWNNNYGSRISGAIYAPITGDYTFWISGNRYSELWLSTDASESNKQRIAHVSGWVSSQEWTKYPEQQSVSVPLQKGQAYYIEAIHKDGSREDHIAVGWQVPGSTDIEVLSKQYFSPPVSTGIVREWWFDIAGENVSDLTSSAAYPESPSGREQLGLFEGPNRWDDNYGSRISGVLYPPTTGDYSFLISGDDFSELWLSTDTSEDNKQLIAEVPGWSAPRIWTKYPQQRSVSIRLQEGQAYYIEALHKEGLHGDNIAVAWQLPGSSAIEVLTEQYFIAPGDLATDSDGDGVADINDAFPNDPTETTDTDGDGVGDNADVFPNDPNESSDSDGDGVGDNEDAFPNDPGRSELSEITPLPSFPRNSSTLLVELHEGEDRIWNVNPDNNSVSVSNSSGELLIQIAVGKSPWALAKSASTDQVFVTNKGASSLSIINTQTLTVEQTIDLPSNSQPHGIVFDNSDTYYYVVLEASAAVEKRLVSSHSLTATLSLSGTPRHISMKFDDSQLYVSNFITPLLPGESSAVVDVVNGNAEVFVIEMSSFSISNTIALTHDDRAVSESQGPGMPNYLSAPIVSFDNAYAYIPSKKDNIDSGALRGKLGITFESTVRANTSRINLATEAEDATFRVDHDNSSVATHAALTGDNRYLLVALETSRELVVYDTQNNFQVMRLPTGRAPQAVALSSDGSQAYVHNFMDRSISRFNLTQMLQTDLPASNLLSAIQVVTNEQLDAEVLLGKQYFYDAADDRLALDNYMSCASCHKEAKHDGRVWDLGRFGEGLRNTTSLVGKAGTAQGLLHWTGNFDEVQDFEAQIRSLAGGTGLMSDEDFYSGSVNEPLGDIKAGLSADLDALAAYLDSLNEPVLSPLSSDLGFSAEAQLGAQLFVDKACASCHSGTSFTDSESRNRHDIGTLKAGSGQRLSQVLDGLDTPTLQGLWTSPPYLHDGSAATVEQAITSHSGISISPSEAASIARYLHELP